MTKKRILITGASGFIGSCLARKMVEKGNDVHIFLRSDSNTWRIENILEKCEVHRIDIADRKSVAEATNRINPEVTYHLATYGAYSTQKDTEKIVQTNLLGGINLLDACGNAGCKRFINISTSSEYGIKEKPMKETDLLEPNSTYGITKAAFTHYCSYAHKYRGIPITTFRIFAAYGYYEEPMRLIPSIITACLKNERPQLSSPDSVRDFIFVEDVIDAFEKAVEVPEANGEILNLGTGVQHSIKEVAETAIQLIGCKNEVIWGAMEKRQPEPKSWVADMKKTKRVLKWKPRYSLREGLEKTISWFRQNIKYYKGEKK